MPKAEIDARVANAAARCSASRRCSTAIRASSPAASASASPSAAPSCATRRSSCSTSRSRNLDAQLRDEMRGEIKRLHQEIATTMIYVTHDQIEAMTLADRIVLMRDGVIEQQGAPLELFERPATLFVAGFLGSPKMNFLPGTLRSGGRASPLRLGDSAACRCPRTRLGERLGRPARPPRPRPRASEPRRTAPAPAPGTHGMTRTIELIQPTGSRSYATFRLAGAPVVAELQAHDVEPAGRAVRHRHEHEARLGV